MVGVLVSFWLLAGLSAQAISASQPDALGVWVNDKSNVAVRIVRCGSDLCGRIAWLAEPYHDNGALKRDRQNPNPGKREQPLCGLQVLDGFRQTAEHTWEDGLIYDPRKGKTYHSYLTLAEPDQLQVRAYVLFPLLGKTQTWHRTPLPASECPRHARTRNTADISR